MRIAVYQCALGGADAERRLERLEWALRQPATAGADIVVCPELFMSGYNVGDRLEQAAQPIEGPFARAVAGLARAHAKAIIYGYPERDGERVFNSAACYGPDGVLMANHRKLVLPPGFERQYFRAGDRLTLFDIGDFKCALIVCYDAEFPEIVRAAARKGAQLVIAPTALNRIWESVATRLIPTRAFENGVYFVYANHAGEEGGITYLGKSCIVAPDGEDAARAGAAEQVIAARIELQAVNEARARLPYLRDREQLFLV
jgi:predicted amidohydrolase